jgi:hypothetical protein
MKKYLLPCSLTLLVLVFLSASSYGETRREKIKLPYDSNTRRPTKSAAETLAKKEFLKRFLTAKLSPNLVNDSKLAEKIELALEPPDSLITSFKFLRFELTADETEVDIWVEGVVDTAAMVAALVQNKVITFGKNAPKVMFLSAADSEFKKATLQIRSLIYSNLKQAGLRPVDDTNTEIEMTSIKNTGSARNPEIQAMQRKAKEYGADFLVSINSEIALQSVGGGYVTDVNVIYSVKRPNTGELLGDGTITGRGQGTSRMTSLNDAFDKIAPEVAQYATGQLYESIFSDSDVLTDAPQAAREKTVAVDFENSAIVNALIEKLREVCTNVSLGVGMTNVHSRLKVETRMEDVDLYQWFNAQTITVGGKKYKTPVVAYAENVIEVEAVAVGGAAHRKPLATPPRRKPTTAPSTGGPSIAEIRLRQRGK